MHKKGGSYGDIFVTNKYAIKMNKYKNDFFSESFICALMDCTYIAKLINKLHINYPFISESYHLIFEKYQMTLNEFIENNNFGLRMKLFPRLLKDISTGLDYLHNFNMIHNDLSSNNIMVSLENNNIKFVLIDLGFVVNSYMAQHHHHLGGSIAPPECIFNMSKYIYDIDNVKKIDSWAFGNVLHKYIYKTYAELSSTMIKIWKLLENNTELDNNVLLSMDPFDNENYHNLLFNENIILCIDSSNNNIPKCMSDIIDGFLTLNIKKRFDCRQFSHDNPSTSELINQLLNYIENDEDIAKINIKIKKPKNLNKDTIDNEDKQTIEKIINEHENAHLECNCYKYPTHHDVNSQFAIDVFKKITNVESTNPFIIFICFEACLRYELNDYNDIIMLLAFIDNFINHVIDDDDELDDEYNYDSNKRIRRDYHIILKMTNKQFLEEKCKIYNKINGRLLNPHLIKNMNYNNFYIAKPICNEIAKWNETSCDASRIHNFIDVGIPSPNIENIISLINSNDLRKMALTVDFCFDVIQNYSNMKFQYANKCSFFFKFHNIYVMMITKFIEKNYDEWNNDTTKKEKEYAITIFAFKSLHYVSCIFPKYPLSLDLINDNIKSINCEYENKSYPKYDEFFSENISYLYLLDCTYGKYILQTNIIEWDCFDDVNTCKDFGGSVKYIVTYLCFLHSLTFEKQSYNIVLLFQEFARIIFKNIDIIRNLNNDNAPLSLLDFSPKNYELFSLIKKIFTKHDKLRYSKKAFSKSRFLRVYDCFSNVYKIFNNVHINFYSDGDNNSNSNSNRNGNCIVDVEKIKDIENIENINDIQNIVNVENDENINDIQNIVNDENDENIENKINIEIIIESKNKSHDVILNNGIIAKNANDDNKNNRIIPNDNSVTPKSDTCAQKNSKIIEYNGITEGNTVVCSDCVELNGVKKREKDQENQKDTKKHAYK
jgi:serine/threonine protein kinase